MKIRLFSFTSLFFVILFSMNCKSQFNVSKVSNGIYSIQKSEFGNNMLLKALKLYREQSNWVEKLEYSIKNDTVFILERPGIQGDYSFTFWNKTDTLSYTNETGLFEFTNKSLFIKQMMKLVSTWNIEEIEIEEKKNSNFIPNETIYATKIIFFNKQYKIDCICFKDFFNLQRDGMDFRE